MSPSRFQAPAGATTATAGDGSYAFAGLNAGTYSVSAPATAAGLTLVTASPLSVILAAGGTQPNVNFGYNTINVHGRVHRRDWRLRLGRSQPQRHPGRGRARLVDANQPEELPGRNSGNDDQRRQRSVPLHGRVRGLVRGDGDDSRRLRPDGNGGRHQSGNRQQRHAGERHAADGLLDRQHDRLRVRERVLRKAARSDRAQSGRLALPGE